jgi:hypothetical protein
MALDIHVGASRFGHAGDAERSFRKRAAPQKP